MTHLPLPTVVTSEAQLVALVQDLSSQPTVAVDTESNSLYAYHERVCLIQFSSPDGDTIVDPLADLDLEPLGELFANPDVQKVFHAAEQDVAGLKRDLGCEFANLFDTMWAARILGWPKVGLANVLKETFGVHTNKRYQRHNWGKRPLEPAALAYARRDTHYLLPLRALQAEALEQLGRAEEAAEVFAHMAKTSPATNPFGPEAFWRVKGIRDLSKKELAILWQLYSWRDQEANQRDRPPFKIVGDKTLVALAQSQPHRRGDLARISGLSQYLIRRYGDTILALVERGTKSPAPKPPSHSPRPRKAVTARYKTLRDWRRQVAAKRQVATDVILSNATLWSLAEQNPKTMADLKYVEGFGPWKRKTYGESILKVLRKQ